MVNNLELTEGTHSVTVVAKDVAGNETTETRYFTVDTNSEERKPAISVNLKNDAAVLGQTVSLDIRSTGKGVGESSTSISLGNMFKETEVVGSDAYEVDSKLNKLTNTITVNAKKRGDIELTDDELIATITVKVPETLKEGDEFTYSVKGGYYITEDNAYGTFSSKGGTIPVNAPLNIVAEDVTIDSGENARILVEDSEGKPVENATIYLIEENGEREIGITDSSGILETDEFGKTAATYTIYAKKEFHRMMRRVIAVVRHIV